MYALHKPHFSFTHQVFCYHLPYSVYFPVYSHTTLTEWANYFYLKFIAKCINWIISLVNVESLSTIRSFGGLKMYMTLCIRASVITCAILDFIGITKLKLVILYVVTKIYLNSSHPWAYI